MATAELQSAQDRFLEELQSDSQSTVEFRTIRDRLANSGIDHSMATLALWYLLYRGAVEKAGSGRIRLTTTLDTSLE